MLIFYPHIKPFIRKKINLPLKLNLNWISGFLCGHGGFSIKIISTNNYKLKKQITCIFHVAQHNREIELLILFSKYFNCGTIYERLHSSKRYEFIVQDIILLITNILPHFNIYPILNLKYKDYIC